MADSRYVDSEELEGKTVAKVIESDSRILMRFTDGTFTSLRVNPGYYGDPGDVEFDEPTDRDSLLKLGILSQEEADAAREVERKADFERCRLNRLRQYQELRREFEE